MSDSSNKILTDFSRGIILVLILFSATTSLAQEKKLSPKKHKEIAIKSERYGDIYSAIIHYKHYLETKTNLKGSDVYYAYKLAELYRKIRDYENAKIWYKTVYKFDKKNYPEALFYYATMLKMTGDYQKSTESFNAFKKINKDKKNKSYYRKYIKLETEGNHLAKSLIDSPLNVEIYHLDESINQAHIELSPVFVDESTFYYASLKSDSVILFQENEIEKLPTTKFYEAQYKIDKWQGTKEVPYVFNELDGNLGNGCFSQDRNTFYFTKCQKNDKGKTICAIYMVKKEMGIWDEPKKLNKEINLSKFTSTHPAVGIDPKKGYEVLYFVSDRPGGRGGKDIWYTIYDEKKGYFKEPKNAGGKINTIGDDITPYYDLENRRLYYSSNARPGLGGFDVYKTFGHLKKWEVPENIGYPINSAADDLYYSINRSDHSKGLFVSNREGGKILENITCCDDIYYFEYLDFIHLGVAGYVYEMKQKDSLQYIEDILSEGQDADSTLRVCIPNVNIDLYVVDSNDNILIREIISDTSCTYLFGLEQDKHYKIVASKKGYFSKQVKISTVGRFLSDTLIRHLKLSPIPKEPIIVKNIYYPFDEHSLTDSAKAIIDSTIYVLLSENPTIIAELSSHTDSKGSDYYNFQLSEKRANSVVDYLVEKGIEKERLKARGYGETHPIAPNKKEDGTDDPIGRQKNRRTEFKVIGELEQHSEVIYEE